MDEDTVKLRQELVRNKALAGEISQALSKFKLNVPNGMTIVWEPSVVLEPEVSYEAYHYLINGIPNPEILAAAQQYRQEFAVKRNAAK